MQPYGVINDDDDDRTPEPLKVSISSDPAKLLSRSDFANVGLIFDRLHRISKHLQ